MHLSRLEQVGGPWSCFGAHGWLVAFAAWSCVLFRAVLSFAGPVVPGPVVPWGGPRFGPCGPFGRGSFWAPWALCGPFAFSLSREEP